MNRKSKNTEKKNRWDFVEIFTCDRKIMFVLEFVRMRVCLFVWVLAVYYCVCMCEWWILHVYEKIYAQRVVFTGC